MKLKMYNQWEWPPRDFELIRVGFSYFGPYDYLDIYWTAQLTIMGFQIILYRYIHDHED